MHLRNAVDAEKQSNTAEVRRQHSAESNASDAVEKVKKKCWNDWSSSGVRISSKKGRGERRLDASPR
jgi:hypothetical protein